MKSKIEEEVAGAGGKKSKKKLDRLGFKPQITLKKMPHIMQSNGKVDLNPFSSKKGIKHVHLWP